MTGKNVEPKLIKSKKIADIKEVMYQFEFLCKKPLNDLHFRYNLFFDVSVTHENITDIHLDTFSQEIIFSKDNPTIDINYKQFRNKLIICNFLPYYHFSQTRDESYFLRV